MTNWQRPRIFESYEEVVPNDPTVLHATRSGLSLEDTIVALVNEKQILFEKLVQLQSIAPRKVKLPDGRIFVWRCPDELIPLSEE